MPIEEIIAFIMAFLTGGAFKSLVDYLIERRRKQDRFKELFERIHDVYKILNYVKNNTAAKRVSIIKSQNGGSALSVEKIITSTILYEVWDNPFNSLKKSWKGQRVDEAYVEIAKKLHVHKNVFVVVDDLPHSILKDVLVRSGVKYSDQYEIGVKPTSFIYISLHFDNRPDVSPRYRDILRVAINSLKEIFTGEKI